MNIIENNPFRILGIISNTSARDALESETFILRYLEIGKSTNLKFDITPPLNSLIRTKELVTDAKRKIHDDLDKLLYSIFWFVNGSKIDEIALNKLSSEKNIDQALESFRKGSRNFEISTSSFSSILNHSTLEIINYTNHQDAERVKNSIKNKYRIIKDNFVFKSFESLITSNSGKINQELFIDRYIQNTRYLLKELFPRHDQNKLLLEIFSEEESIRKEIENQIVKSILDSINTKINSFDLFNAPFVKNNSTIVSSKSSIIKQLKKLVSETKSDLNKLKGILGVNNFQFTNLIDEIYSRVNGSVIMCYNKEMDSLNNALKLGYKSTITSTSFKSYVDVLQDASNAVSSINCSIKSTIIENLRVIKKVNGELLELKRNIKSSSTYGYGSSNYGGGSSYSGGSSNNKEWVVTIIICLICGGGCAAVIGEPGFFWLGAGFAFFSIISNK